MEKFGFSLKLVNQLKSSANLEDYKSRRNLLDIDIFYIYFNLCPLNKDYRMRYYSPN
jgi:hypothetical protein